MSQSSTSNLSSSSALSEAETKAVYAQVKQAYSKKTEESPCSASVCLIGKQPPLVLEAVKKVPTEVSERYFGCGTPIPFGIKGLNVLDIGSGAGRDAYVIANLVGEHGSVTGLDMTDAQLEIARKYVDSYARTLGYSRPNMRFVKGVMEDLKGAGLTDNSMDLVVSNCVICLSPDKRKVFKNIFNVLKEGGELYFSDIYVDRRLPENIKKNLELWSECIGATLYVEDLVRFAKEAGFTEPRMLSGKRIEVGECVRAMIGDVQLYSITYRLFKAKNLESGAAEDYGQLATYLGTIPGHEHSYQLDFNTTFETNKPKRVSGNTAVLVGETWLRPHFRVQGDRSSHYGTFKESTPQRSFESLPVVNLPYGCGSKAPAASSSSSSASASEATAMDTTTVTASPCCAGGQGQATTASPPQCCAGGQAAQAPACAISSCCGGKIQACCGGKSQCGKA